MISLRPYQSEIIDATRAHFVAGRRRVLVQLPTGGGKTALASRMLHGAADKGKRVWFCVHRRELIRQVSQAFQRDGLAHSIVAADQPMNYAAQAQICSIQTLVKRADKLPPPDVIVWDECHHIGAASWSALAAKFPNAYHVGLSATPQRMDGRGLADHFDVMVRGPSVRELMDDGYLSRYRLFAPSKVDLTGLHTRMGDYVTAELNERMNRPTITGDAISHYRKYCDGALAIAFCVSIEHSKAVAAGFRAAGVQALHVDGATDSYMRDQIMADFAAGKIRVLTNCDLFGEGVDVPNLQAAILLRPTMSVAMYLQQVGRALRPAPDKEHAVILDHVGNSHTHGLPDEDREWELSPTVEKRKGKPKIAPPRICGHCFAASPAGSQKCVICNEAFAVEPREIEQADGELSEIEVAAQKREARREQGKADSLASLQELARIRGYSPRWAYMIWQARQKKRGLG